MHKIISMSSDAPFPPRRVVVLGLGGTIAMTPRDHGDGVVPQLSTAQLLAAVPGLADTGITVETVDLRRLPSGSLTFADLAEVRTVIAKQFADGVDGVVVTQGTDTIEETSYLLDLTHDRPEPIVVTGAMRNPGQAGADGPANLLAAILTAADPLARDLGVLVVLADEIHAARRVRKSHTTSPGAFQSPDGGPLGVILEGRPRLPTGPPIARSSRPVRRAPASPGRALPVAGDDGERCRVSRRLDGLVVAGFGGGLYRADGRPVGAAGRPMPVVLACRTGAGASLATTYAYPAPSGPARRGLIRAGFLDPYKARILLHTLLTTTRDRDTIAAAFAVAGDYADPADWTWPSR